MRTGNLSLLLALHGAALASAQSNTISIYAGGGPINGPALAINVAYPQGVAAAANGEVYFSSVDRNAVYKLSGGLAILIIAGTPGVRGFSGDGGPATSATLSGPTAVTVDDSGNLYIADSSNRRIRTVSADTGVITTVAGNGNYGYGGDDGPATSASFSYLNGVAVDGGGNLYIADSGYCGRGGCSGSNRIRKVSADTGVITTVAGNGNFGYSGDGGLATSASLWNPDGVAGGRQRESLYCGQP